MYEFFLTSMRHRLIHPPHRARGRASGLHLAGFVSNVVPWFQSSSVSSQIELTGNLREEEMRLSKIALTVAVALGSSLPIAGSANAAIAAAGMTAAFDRLAVVDHVQYRYGGHRHCWYDDGWHGHGWYWCGYGARRGYGWGGEEGYRGWRH
jgi:hypothetical protein